MADLNLGKLHEDILDVEKFISTELKIEVFIEQGISEIINLSNSSLDYDKN